MTAEESQRVEQLSAHMSARCIGRYLIDLPAVFVLNSQSVTEIEGVKISVRPMTKENFEMAWATRGAELEKTVLLSSKLPMLRSIVPLPAGQLGGVFDRAEDKFRGRLGRTLELMAWKDGYQILGEIKATDNTFPEYETGSIAKSLKTDVPQKLSHLLEIYEKIRGRADDEIPNGQGFCFPYGIYEAASKEDEETYISYHLENVRDVYFHLGANPEKLKGQETLLERSASVMLEMKISGVETIRKGKVTYQALPYEEWLMKGPTPARVPGTMFLRYWVIKPHAGLANPLCA